MAGELLRNGQFARHFLAPNVYFVDRQVVKVQDRFARPGAPGAE